jgi:hypothetical protein
MAKGEKQPKAEGEKHAGGRPSDYTKDLGDLICELLAQGHSLRKICRLEDMPHFVTVFRWMQKDEEFCKQYRAARDVQADYFMDEIVDIADDTSEDELFTEDGRKCMNSEFVQRSKLRIDARKWAASKIAPKKYGDKVSIGGDPDNPLVHEHKHDISDDMLAAIATGKNG